ncbi:universal stress protein [Streptomyces sp. NPDC058122]|uniref:universal stress protein n=1 Tax=Streptomyces sp. NPDC058122 TaxID=3346349 RepID=UPI0036E31221
MWSRGTTVQRAARKVLVRRSAAADLVVLGARRRSGRLGLRFGRVSNALRRHAACPASDRTGPGRYDAVSPRSRGTGTHARGPGDRPHSSLPRRPQGAPVRPVPPRLPRRGRLRRAGRRPAGREAPGPSSSPDGSAARPRGPRGHPTEAAYPAGATRAGGPVAGRPCRLAAIRSWNSRRARPPSPRSRRCGTRPRWLPRPPRASGPRPVRAWRAGVGRPSPRTPWCGRPSTRG